MDLNLLIILLNSVWREIKYVIENLKHRLFIYFILYEYVNVINDIFDDVFIQKKFWSCEYFQMEKLIISTFLKKQQKEKPDYIWGHLKIEAFQEYKNVVTVNEASLCVNYSKKTE